MAYISIWTFMSLNVKYQRKQKTYFSLNKLLLYTNIILLTNIQLKCVTQLLLFLNHLLGLQYK